MNNDLLNYNVFSLLDYTLKEFENIEIELYANGFYGFYESLFNHSDMFIDDISAIESEMEDLHPLIYDNYIKDNVDYDITDKDYRKYVYDICENYTNNYYDKIDYALNDIFNLYDNYEFEIIDNSIKMYNPKFYNYSTDEINFKVKTNYHTLNKIQQYVLYENSNKFIEYIKNNKINYDLRKDKFYVESKCRKYYKSIDIYDNIEIDDLIESFLLIHYDTDIFEDINISTYYDISVYDYDLITTINFEPEYIALDKIYHEYLKSNFTKYYHMLKNHIFKLYGDNNE